MHQVSRADVAKAIQLIRAASALGTPLTNDEIHRAIEGLVKMANDDPEEFLLAYEPLDGLSAEDLSEVGGHAIDQESKGAFHLASCVWSLLRNHLVEGTPDGTRQRSRYVAALNLLEAITLLRAEHVGPGLVEQARYAGDAVFDAGLSLALIVHQGTGGSDLSVWANPLARAVGERTLRADARSILDRLAKPRP